MELSIRPVLPGLLLGILGLLFGISWAFYISLNHESIHRVFNESAKAAIAGKFVINSAQGHDHSAHSHGGSSGSHDMADHAGGAAAPADSISAAPHTDAHGHDSAFMEAAHERLTRGHLHAMGLGILTISVSVVIAFLTAPSMIKTLASVCMGMGGLLYPLAWILMGYRTPALGIDGAHASVVPIAGLSVLMVVSGIFICMVYVVKGMFRKG